MSYIIDLCMCVHAVMSTNSCSNKKSQTLGTNHPPLLYDFPKRAFSKKNIVCRSCHAELFASWSCSTLRNAVREGTIKDSRNYCENFYDICMQINGQFFVLRTWPDHSHIPCAALENVMLCASI